MTYEDVMTRVASLDAEIARLQIERQTVLNTLIDRAPYWTGDVIMVPRKTCVHQGKQCRISSATVKNDSFIFRAIVLKKDGTDSANDVRWREPVPED